MKLARRAFLGAAAGGGLAACAGPAPSDRERRPVRVSLRKSDLPTPALVLDLDLFEANLRTMAEHCRRAGRAFRPHAKTHKCPEIARRQVASGALGVCVATVPEAEAMAAGGLRGILLTSPVVEPSKVARWVALARPGAGLLAAVGHAREADLLAQAAAAARVRLDVLVDLDVGDGRTGVPPGARALELAQRIGALPALRLVGLQAYSGQSSHTVGFEARLKTSREAMAKAVEARELLRKAGFDTSILSGGSTGTYNIDTGDPGVTELQVGSYVFMDVDYRRIGGRDGPVYSDFHPSLAVLTTVVSASHPDRVTVDAGTKALDTTTAWKPEPRGGERHSYARAGDEFGIVRAEAGAALPRIGDRLELIVPHCDPTVNLYDRIYAARGDRVEEAWPVAARREHPSA